MLLHRHGTPVTAFKTASSSGPTAATESRSAAPGPGGNCITFSVRWMERSPRSCAHRTPFQVAVGSGLGKQTALGALIDDRAVARTQAYTGNAVNLGAALLTGAHGYDSAGHFFAPTVLDRVREDTYVGQLTSPIVSRQEPWASTKASRPTLPRSSAPSSSQALDEGAGISHVE